MVSCPNRTFLSTYDGAKLGIIDPNQAGISTRLEFQNPVLGSKIPEVHHLSFNDVLVMFLD